MRRIPAFLGLALLSLSGVAFAGEGQEPPPVPPAPKQEQPKAPAEKPPVTRPPAKKPAEDTTPVTGTLYSVRLKTGRTVRGVVHAAGRWERKDRLEGWTDAKREDEGAGLRLWYPNRLDGFLFAPAKDIAQIEDLGLLSAEEGLKIAREKTDAASRADAERAQIKAEAEERAAKEAAAAAARAEVEAARKEAAGAAGEPVPAAAGAMVPLDRAKRFAELLEQFPPTVWRPETPKEIERRRITLDLFPTDQEKEFLSVYAEWREAFEFWKRSQGAAGGGGTAAVPAK